MKKQNEAIRIIKYYKYRLAKKRILIKLKSKYEVMRWEHVYDYCFDAYNININDSLKIFLDNKASLWDDYAYKASSYNLLKKALPLKELTKEDISFYTTYYIGDLRKKMSYKTVTLPIYKYARLKNIPLKYLILQHRRSVHLKKLSEILRSFNNSIRAYKKNSSFRWRFYYNIFAKSINILYYKLIHYNNKINKLYYFKKSYNYSAYKDKIIYKNKIPSYN